MISLPGELVVLDIKSTGPDIVLGTIDTCLDKIWSHYQAFYAEGSQVPFLMCVIYVNVSQRLASVYMDETTPGAVRCLRLTVAAVV